MSAPIRQRAAHIPQQRSPFARCCAGCQADFIALAFDGTGERGIWRDWKWYCSIECDPLHGGSEPS